MRDLINLSFDFHRFPCCHKQLLIFKSEAANPGQGEKNVGVFFIQHDIQSNVYRTRRNRVPEVGLLEIVHYRRLKKCKATAAVTLCGM